MRKTLMALAAVSLAIPASMAIPTEGANARRHYEYREWRGDRATGTILGAAGGALLGKEIDSKRRCR